MKSEIGAALREARRQKRLSQAKIARQAGVTQAHVSMVERGLNAHLSVAEQLANALGLRLSLEPQMAYSYRENPYGEDVIANRLYRLARLAAKRVTLESLSQFRALVERSRNFHGNYPYFKNWLMVCDAGPDALISLLTDPTEHGRYMRSVAPLRAFVTKEERDEYFRPNFQPPVDR